MRLVYTRRYNIGFPGIERLHPFDPRKYGRAWRAVGVEERQLRDEAWAGVPRPVSFAELAAVHDPAYLRSLRGVRGPGVMAAALELPFVQRIPGWLTRWAVLRPMRWATAGSLVAARHALTDGLAVNLSGGFHHAKPGRGEGFCLFNDIAYLAHALRAEGRLAPDDRLVYVDLDAHQGNGVCHHFLADRRVFIYDAFNPRVYPASDVTARGRIDCEVPLPAGCTGHEYMRLLQLTLPNFLGSVGRNGRVGLAVYNAGTDVYAGDALGRLGLPAEAVVERDLYVVSQLRARGIPTVMVLSGGYSRESYRMVAGTVVELLRRYRAKRPPETRPVFDLG